MRKFKASERGQGMTEYIILVALIAVAAIGAVKYFGGKTKEGFNDAGKVIEKDINKDLRAAKE